MSGDNDLDLELEERIAHGGVDEAVEYNSVVNGLALMVSKGREKDMGGNILVAHCSMISINGLNILAQVQEADDYPSGGAL